MATAYELQHQRHDAGTFQIPAKRGDATHVVLSQAELAMQAAGAACMNGAYGGVFCPYRANAALS